MKVKITHTARYEDVPNIINEILTKCRTELKIASELKFNILRLEDTVIEVARVQDTLDLVSTQLEDCLSLSQGYVQVQQQLNNSAESTPDFSEDLSEQDE